MSNVERWIAINDTNDEIIATGDTLEEIYAKSKELGVDDPLVTTVLEEDTAMFF